ncbi:transformer-2 protein homolog alpha-like isoform X2 [Toxorhynchites rutilus septentrionalis]|nr:transformer-2 protein homolog alpha-like isoform X2 [Toxorhynchites rutilus septentrionalis]XP_055626389.1 transformer-2 protein homolog alpha-like isoform X2 [Toxorhynchites rutilus septentrionalis]XP_055626390.1 transformer-2 protein homolog alpha-like isoform X2 [Toxorhynchites rutilus septentrionalis]
MSYSKSQYYEPGSRSRSRDRKYRREYREMGDRYSSSYGSSMYGTGSSGSYARRPSKRPYESAGRYESHESTSASASGGSKLVLAVFNLSVHTTETELYDVFSKFGPLNRANVVLDAKTGRSRGFGFVYFDSVEDAKVAHAQANGIEIGDRRIRVDYSATDKPHDPTPGVYYGKVSYPRGGGHPLGPPAPVADNMAPQPYSSSGGGYYHCRACEIEARERERWEREARRYDSGPFIHSEQYYYQDKYAPSEPRSRDRSAMSRSRSEYYRGGASVR